MNTVTNRPYLIDWEYSGMNDPTWDIAAYIGESRLTRHAIDEFLSFYYGANGPTREELMKIKGIGKVKATQILSVVELTKYMTSGASLWKERTVKSKETVVKEINND